MAATPKILDQMRREPTNPRINIQDDKGKAKAYQVRQVLLAIEKLEGIRNER
jgi:hypothetical protein